MNLKTWLLLSLAAGALHCQPQYCNIQAGSMVVGSRITYNNTTQQCSNWVVTYYTEGYSVISFEFDGAADVNGVPGAWNLVTSNASGECTVTGVNPSHSEIGGVILFTGCYYPWFSLYLQSATGSGSVATRAYGSAAPTIAGSGGGNIDATYYVATTGSDTNPCSVALPCATVNHTIGRIPIYSTGNYTIMVANGTYNECPSFANFINMTGGVYLIGNDAAPTNVVFTGQCSFTSPDGAVTAGLLFEYDVGQFTVDGVTIAPSTASTWSTYVAQAALYVTYKNVYLQGSVAQGLGCSDSAQCAIDTAIHISNFAGDTNNSANGIVVGRNAVLTSTNNATETILPKSASSTSIGIYTQQGGRVYLTGTGSVVYNCNSSTSACYGLFADQDSSLSINTAFFTMNNSSTPSNSYIVAAKNNAALSIASGGTLTAANWTGSCSGANNGTANVTGTLAFTSVGSASTTTGGICSVL